MFKIKPGDKPKQKVKRFPLATAVSTVKFKEFETIASQHNLTKSELLRQIVEQFLSEQRKVG